MDDEHDEGCVTQPTPADRLHEHLAQLPPAGVRALLIELERAQARARATKRAIVVAVAFEVGRDGAEGVEITTRYEGRTGRFR